MRLFVCETSAAAAAGSSIGRGMTDEDHGDEGGHTLVGTGKSPTGGSLLVFVHTVRTTGTSRGICALQFSTRFFFFFKFHYCKAHLRIQNPKCSTLPNTSLRYDGVLSYST